MSASLVALHRHPLKGFTAENLDAVQLTVGQGLPSDRHFAVVSGNREDVPQAGGWVQSRTFLNLTVYPELARFRCALEDDDTTLVVTDPEGQQAIAQLGESASFPKVDALIRQHFEDGPFGTPRLVEQTPGYGHWDFSDTALSIINLATVRVISEAVGRPLEMERFRGNLYIDGLEPWEEFSWAGCQISVGGVVLDVLRPIQRCAMTSTEPGTGLRDVDVPAAITKAFGHNFCGMYARVAAPGRVAPGDAIEVTQTGNSDPYQDLPERVADPALWPRFVRLGDEGDGKILLRPADASWGLLPAQPGQSIRFLSRTTGVAPVRGRVLDGTPEGILLDASSLPRDMVSGDVLIAGPFGRTSR